SLVPTTVMMYSVERARPSTVTVLVTFLLIVSVTSFEKSSFATVILTSLVSSSVSGSLTSILNDTLLVVGLIADTTALAFVCTVSVQATRSNVAIIDNNTSTFFMHYLPFSLEFDLIERALFLYLVIVEKLVSLDRVPHL